MLLTWEEEVLSGGSLVSSLGRGCSRRENTWGREGKAALTAVCTRPTWGGGGRGGGGSDSSRPLPSRHHGRSRKPGRAGIGAPQASPLFLFLPVPQVVKSVVVVVGQASRETSALVFPPGPQFPTWLLASASTHCCHRSQKFSVQPCGCVWELLREARGALRRVVFLNYH